MFYSLLAFSLVLQDSQSHDQFFWSNANTAAYVQNRNGSYRVMVPQLNSSFKFVETKQIQFGPNQPVEEVYVLKHYKNIVGPNNQQSRIESTLTMYATEAQFKSFASAETFRGPMGELYILRPPDKSKPKGRWDLVLNPDKTPYCDCVLPNTVDSLKADTDEIIAAGKKEIIKTTQPTSDQSQPRQNPAPALTSSSGSLAGKSWDEAIAIARKSNPQMPRPTTDEVPQSTESQPVQPSLPIAATQPTPRPATSTSSGPATTTQAVPPPVVQLPASNPASQPNQATTQNEIVKKLELAGKIRGELNQDMHDFAVFRVALPEFPTAIGEILEITPSMSTEEREKAFEINAVIVDARESILTKSFQWMQNNLTETRANRLIVSLTLFGEFRGDTDRNPAHLFWARQTMKNRAGSTNFPAIQRTINSNFGEYGNWLKGKESSAALARTQFSSWNLLDPNLRRILLRGTAKEAVQDVFAFSQKNDSKGYPGISEFMGRSEAGLYGVDTKDAPLLDDVYFYVSHKSFPIPQKKPDGTFDRENWKAFTDRAGKTFFTNSQGRVIYDDMPGSPRIYPSWWPKVNLGRKLPSVRDLESGSEYIVDERAMRGGVWSKSSR